MTMKIMKMYNIRPILFDCADQTFCSKEGITAFVICKSGKYIMNAVFNP